VERLNAEISGKAMVQSGKAAYAAVPIEAFILYRIHSKA
jgi:hypothetical protein